MFKFFVPKSNVFFNLFNQSASNNVRISELLYKAVSSDSPHEEKMHFNQIARLKTIGNDLKHQVYTVSSRSLISPFERNDMYALASAINQVCDTMHVAARRLSLYQLSTVEPAIKEISGLIIEASMELDKSVNYLSNLSLAADIAACCKKIRQLENYADQVYDKALSSLAHNETNGIELIKYTEILAALERATDRCEDATDVIESIVVKNT
ncbi:DUF47 domain-containing protein [Mucilaginibacter terrae]|uniref:Uncharacterized protein Yka (UPF0111/DUF47 family) n=1 Tax=Mucilaginibacter terrae TaxID=1955052 RepID=A0ABU3GWU3_9SPHI|nr:DUF47 family protein [Mucilaginibacter terrae]MDT3404224.1 uncharacterized protein Yka (UPF0111/DUF47 family) [Mucilaginibacter terrae]